jgi:Fe-S cluster biogenesis protein NfuA
MFIQTEATPNPRTLKFLPGRDVLGQGSREYADADAGLGSPLATALGDSSAPADETDEADIVYEGDAAGIVKELKEIIDARVRPAVARDGGDITFHSWDHEHGIVRLNMRGSCAGCPSSTLTLKQGIENMLRHYVPEVNAVEQVV